MNKSESDPLDQQVKAWLESDKPQPRQIVETQRLEVAHRTRASIGQRDTIMFAFIKMWTVLADMLAPLFASFAAKKTITIKPKKTNRLPKNN